MLKYFELPEKVLQFGTGVLLRGLPDFFIDKANAPVYLNRPGSCSKIDRYDHRLEFDDQDSLYLYQ